MVDENTIEIGEFKITTNPKVAGFKHLKDTVWIAEEKGDGDAATFNLKLFEDHIKQFFNKHF